VAKDMAKLLIDEMEPLAQEHGLELVTIELVGSKKAPIVRIYLDTPDGISFDQIMEAHSWIDAYMDQKDPFPGAYVLEVSSPGIDRPLRKLADYERFAGETVQMSTQPIDGRGKWTGKLVGLRDGKVVLELDDGEVSIDPALIKKANVKGQISFK